jgi:hypothetical protein
MQKGWTVACRLKSMHRGQRFTRVVLLLMVCLLHPFYGEEHAYMPTLLSSSGRERCVLGIIIPCAVEVVEHGIRSGAMFSFVLDSCDRQSATRFRVIQCVGQCNAETSFCVHRKPKDIPCS